MSAIEYSPATIYLHFENREAIGRELCAEAFGHLVAHMVDANNLLCSKAAAVPATNVEQVKDTDSKDNLVAALKASFDFCSDALAKMDDSRLGETTEGFGGKQVTRAWLSLVLAGTWADHYAEAAMYLRLNGVLPPTAKK